MVPGCTTQKKENSNYQETIVAARTAVWSAISAGASSATVAICDNGNVVYKEGFAMANRGEAQPVDDATQFNICSVSKMFVTMSLLQLCEEGKLDLDQPVVTYLPEFSMADERYRKITVRMLLNHSGALNGTDSYDINSSEPDSEFLNYFMEGLNDSHLKGEPGLVSLYCNDGFTLI